MLSGIIAYQVLQQENPVIIAKVKAVLEKHPWYNKPMAGEAYLSNGSVARTPDGLSAAEQRLCLRLVPLS
jgi:hypothetical protein